ncbi:MAG: cytidylyltransferase domain-containing protein [Candidatus Limnocylindrales bacterium]
MHVVVQARLGSTRLPGKVLLPVLGRPLLDFQLERLARIAHPHVTVIATTVNPRDDELARFARDREILFVRGPEHDVLARYVMAADKLGAEVVVRVTSDCPLIDPTVADAIIDRFMMGDVDYVSNTIQRTYPRGLDVEVVNANALRIAAREASKGWDREHVTPFVYGHPQRFRLAQVTGTPDKSDERWTVDTPGDFALVERVLGALYPAEPEFGWLDVVALLDRHSDWRRLNADVAQKGTS